MSGPRLPTLLFDGRCPLCRKEIALLRRLSRGRLGLQDIHGQAAVTWPDQPPADTLLRVLHLVMPDGRWLTGIEATVAAWSTTPFGWLWRPLMWPGLRPLAERGYTRWARQRYQRLYGCRRCLGGEEEWRP